MMQNKSALKLVIWLLCLISGLSAQKPGDWLFGEDRILDFRFHFSQENYLDSLYQSHADKAYIAAALEVDGLNFDSVGVRFKGVSSFWGYPGDKKSFRIKFDKFIEYRFDGLKKINLNNGWNDPTMLREKLYLDFLTAQNIAAPRANFARVYIDSVYWGFYTLVEHVDKTFLKQRFGNKNGNLYKAEIAPLTWQGENQENYYDDFVLKTNEKENDWSGLINLIKIINDPLTFESGIEQVLDVDSHIRAWAANNLFVNQDSYLGSATNYYLYNWAQSGRFKWILWDVNLCLGARNGAFDLDIFYLPEQRPLHQRFLQVDKFRLRYLESLEQLLNSGYDKNTLYPRIDDLWQLILDDYLADSLKMYSNFDVQRSLSEDMDNVPGLKTFISLREESVAQQLIQVGIKEDASERPMGYHLYQNYPNPFNPATTIKYELSAASQVELSIYSVTGQQLSTLIKGWRPAGIYQLTWNGQNKASGIYYCQLRSGGHLQKIKMLLLK